jgi:hypothetical protein
MSIGFQKLAEIANASFWKQNLNEASSNFYLYVHINIKAKTKLSLCWIKRHIMETSGGAALCIALFTIVGPANQNSCIILWVGNLSDEMF